MKSIDPASRPDHRWRLNLLLIILIGFGLRLFRLGSDSLWYDESQRFPSSLPLPVLLAHTARIFTRPATICCSTSGPP
jgi:hypothetical protein